MSAAAYSLVFEEFGHSADIRCISTSKNDILTGSRDRTVKIWKSDGGNNDGRLLHVIRDHEHWVTALCLLPDGSGIATGCHDSKIRIFSLNGQLLSILEGHKGSISSLSILFQPPTGNGGNEKRYFLLSGSWDGTARVWDLPSSCKHVLSNHENAVVVLGLPNGKIVTGSAGVQTGNSGISGFELRLWDSSNGTLLKTLPKHHTNSIRSLCLLDNQSFFASASNDGTLCIWSIEGDFMNQLYNPPGFEGVPAFTFCVATRGDMLCSASDDCYVRVWDSSNATLVQEIGHPSTVWCVCFLENGDIATGSSDGALRVFSQSSDRQVSKDILAVYSENVTKSMNALRNKQSGGGSGSQSVDVSKLSLIEQAMDGTSDGQVKMFNRRGTAWVYQWMEASKTWVEVGEVMGDANNHGEEVDGVKYDKVLPVEIEDRAGQTGLRKLRLGFNNADNPYSVATAFVTKHGLDEEYVEDIAQYIMKNRTTTNQVPMITSTASHHTAMDIVVEEEEKNKNPPPKTRNKYVPLPDSRGYCFEKVDSKDLSGLQTKIQTVNLETKAPLTDVEIAQISEIISILLATSRYHASSFTKSHRLVVMKMLLQWDSDAHIFPVFDLLRMMLVHPDGQNIITQTPGEQKNQIVPTILNHTCRVDASLATRLTGARLLVNMFRFSDTCELMFQTMTMAKPWIELNESLGKYGNKNVKIAYASILANFLNALYYNQKRVKDFDYILEFCNTRAYELYSMEVAETDDKKLSADFCIRLLICFGTLGLLFPKNNSSSTDILRKSIDRFSNENFVMIRSVLLEVLSII